MIKISNVIKYENESDRVASITVQINTKTTLKIVQCYTPTSTHSDEEMKEFYLQNDLKEYSSTYKFVPSCY